MSESAKGILLPIRPDSVCNIPERDSIQIILDKSALFRENSEKITFEVFGVLYTIITDYW